MRQLLWFVGILVGSHVASPAWAEQPAPKFTRKPSITKVGEKITIEFAVDRVTDVAVFIENSKAEIVRHLVSGVLGKNPPTPLKPNSLEQSIEWDGKAD